MKPIHSLALLLFFPSLLTYSGCEDDDFIRKGKVPKAVMAQFEVDYPNAEKARWSEEDAAYEVEFELGDQEVEALYSATGTLLEVEMEIAWSEVPVAAQNYIQTNYADGTVEEQEQIDRQGVVTYEIEIERGEEEIEVVFDADGNFLSESTEDD